MIPFLGPMIYTVRYKTKLPNVRGTGDMGRVIAKGDSTQSKAVKREICAMFLDVKIVVLRCMIGSFLEKPCLVLDTAFVFEL